jgi:hypothetical protein
MADDGYSTTVTFSSGFCAEVLDVGWDGMSREAIDTTHMTTTNGWMTFLPSDLKDAGELSVSLQFAPNTAPPITGAAETVTVTFPLPAGGSTRATWACSGFMTGMGVAVPNGDKMTADATIKFSGEPTFTPGS